MERHFYRFDTSSALGKQFRTLWNECNKAERAADSFAKKVGAKTYYGNAAAFTGGVECVSFKEGTKINKKMWRMVGKDADGLEQWVPDVKHRSDVMVLPRKDFKPSDTATRIYSKQVLEWFMVKDRHTLEEWAKIANIKLTDDDDLNAYNVRKELENAYFVRYVELYRDDEDSKPKDRRWKLSHVARESIRIERERLKLPIVKMSRFHQLLQADKSAVMNEGKPTIVQESTPTFFEYNRHFYLGIDYPCLADGLTELSSKAYAQVRENLLKMQRDIEALAKSEAKGN